MFGQPLYRRNAKFESGDTLRPHLYLDEIQVQSSEHCLTLTISLSLLPKFVDLELTYHCSVITA